MTKSDDIIDIGSAAFDAANRCIRTGKQAPTHLRPQTSHVLKLLASHTGNVVSKDDIMASVWQNTFVTDDSLVQCISEIRKALGPENAVFLVTVPKIGYRLELPPTKKQPASIGLLIAALLILLLLVAAISWKFLAPPQQEKTQSIAIMPFENMSGDVDQGYFSDGISEDIIVGLSKIPGLMVISRGTSFSASELSDDSRELAELLGVEYILEGSVRRIGDKLRVSATLVDGQTGASLWAERYEGGTDDVFDFQQELIDALMRNLSVRLSHQERARLNISGTQDIDAHDAYLQGRKFESQFTRETNLAAQQAFDRAIRIDPNFAAAYAHLAQVYSYRVENRWTETPDQDVALAFSAAETALVLDATLPYAHFSLGRLYSRSYAPDAEKSIAAFEQAIGLNPSYVDARVFLANVFIFNGQATKALQLAEEAFSRNPLPPFWYFQSTGMAHYFLGNYDQAEADLIRASNQSPTAPFPYRFLVATYGQLGQIDDAEWMMMEYEALGREATISAIMESASIRDPAYRQSYRDGFEKAGMLE